MKIILAHAHTLMYTLMGLMPSRYQRDNLSVMLGLFLAADGKPLPHYSLAKSESALSRFLNTRTWPTRKFIYHVRHQALFAHQQSLSMRTKSIFASDNRPHHFRKMR